MGNIQKANQVRLNHELLIWAGFTLKNGVWSYPDGVTVDDGVPFFPESLDECFKWLVPKLEGVGLWVTPERLYWWEATSLDKDNYYCSYNAKRKNPALALCLAIQKLIRSR
ncbi:hypothetical protein LCGC14_0384670 [marine sediment metagenome]|uniref:Phage ABA sandwich domain-containing protein n=1 Tax=marine sediment metagenome TaxID=412755 RepID=A0A0F9T140_9ZZZZ